MRQLLLTLLLIGWAGLSLRAQSHDVPLQHALYPYLDRLDIRGYTGETVHTDLKPYSRSYVAQVLRRVDTSGFTSAEQGWYRRMRLLADDAYADSLAGKGFLQTFYRNRRDLYHVRTPDFQLYVNPVLHSMAGVDRNNDPAAADPWLPIYYNTRGIQVRGSVLGKIGFHTEVADNVSRIPQFMFNDYLATRTYYGETFIKRFKDANGINYFSSRAYLTFSPWDFMRIKFGKDRAFWGNGIQSVMLSDHAADHLLLNLTTRIWKLEYVNHFAQFIDFIPTKNDTEGTHPRKYGVFHQLSYKPQPWLSVGIFESILYSPAQPNNPNRGFEWYYLNPLIFYRSAEQALGSPDNSFLGAHLKVNFLKRLQFYGQFLLDDYNFARRRDGNGYWGNKFGWQSGLKYVDAFGVPALDLQAEYNQVRPYTYQHFSVPTNYVHYHQPLGHAAGANLEDFWLQVNYHPFAAWNLELRYQYLVQGLDQDGLNFGGDPVLTYINRAGQFEQFVGQGRRQEIQQVQGRLSWQLFQTDMYLEAEGRFRRMKLANEADRYSASVMAGLRMNIAARPLRW